nr:hypothetical protein [Aeromonas salmonicida]
MSSANAAMASGLRQSKGDSAFNSHVPAVLPVEIITKGQIVKIDSDQELQIVNVILLQIFESSGSRSLHQVSAETEMMHFLMQ